jgi:hypothetical protein
MSGRMTCSGMPERRATVRTWWGGTRTHPETVDWSMPQAAATCVAPPARLIRALVSIAQYWQCQLSVVKRFLGAPNFLATPVGY